MRRLKRVQVSHRLSPRLFSREWEATEVNCPFCLQSVLSIPACSAYSPVSCMKHRIPHVTNTFHHLVRSGQARPEQSRHYSWQQPHPSANSPKTAVAASKRPPGTHMQRIHVAIIKLTTASQPQNIARQRHAIVQTCRENRSCPAAHTHAHPQARLASTPSTSALFCCSSGEMLSLPPKILSLYPVSDGTCAALQKSRYM
jgi:hypothetical protein